MTPTPDFWKSFTQAGCDHFQKGDLPAAIHAHARALEYAVQRPTAWVSASHALAARVFSALNLAEAQLGSDHIGDACRTLLDMHDHLRALCADVTTPVALHDAANDHLQEVLAAATRAHRAYSTLPEVDRALGPLLQPQQRVFHQPPPSFEAASTLTNCERRRQRGGSAELDAISARTDTGKPAPSARQERGEHAPDGSASDSSLPRKA